MPVYDFTLTRLSPELLIKSTLTEEKGTVLIYDEELPDGMKRRYYIRESTYRLIPQSTNIKYLDIVDESELLKKRERLGAPLRV